MIAEFTATEQRLDLPANRVGFTQILDFGLDKLTVAEMPVEVENFEIARVGDNSVIETTVMEDGVRTMKLVIFHAIDARHPFYAEFHRSTRKGEIFTIKPNGMRNHEPTEVYRCHRTSTNGIKHYDNCQGISYEFTVEILNG